MSHDLYTSLEVSRRLRDAGAPQKDGDKWAEFYWWVDPEDPDPPQLTHYPHRPYSRAFRADEIIEIAFSSKRELLFIQKRDNLYWGSVIQDLAEPSKWIVFSGSSLADALARAWLASMAVLEERT